MQWPLPLRLPKVARQNGFNSTNQFYVTFRNATGMSPTETREQLHRETTLDLVESN